MLPCWNWAILQIYFCTLNMKYTSTILLKIFWSPNFMTLKSNLNLYVSSILWVHREFSNEVYFKYTLNLFLKCICISFLGQKFTWSRISKFMCCQTQKYTWSRLFKLTNLHSKLKVYLKYTFWIDALFSNSQCLRWTFSFCTHVFIFKLIFNSIQEVDFSNWCNFFSNLEVYLK